MGDKVEVWVMGVKYDVNDIYIVIFYLEICNMMLVFGGFVNKI